MTKQERYDQLVSDIHGSTLVLPDLTPFADYDIRDYLMYESNQNEHFANKVMIKILETVNTNLTANKAMNQLDVEALATGHSIAVMWEQQNASTFELGIKVAVEHGHATEPSLVDLSRRVAKQGAGKMFREGMAKDFDFGQKLRAELNK